MSESAPEPATRTEEESWSAVEAAASEADASFLVGFLASHGIPARVVDESFHLTPTSSEDLTPIEVAVPSSRLEEAKAALEKRDREFEASPESAEGAETVMTDEGPTPIPEPAETGEG